MNDFTINLGGRIDENSIKKSLSNLQTDISSGKIQPLRLKVEFDTDSITTQINTINSKLQETINKTGKTKTSGGSGGDTSTSSPLVNMNDVAEGVNRVKTEYLELNSAVRQTVESIDRQGDKIVTVNHLAEDGTEKLIKTTITQNTHLKENISLYDKIEQRIHNLRQTGTIGAKAARDFTAQLQEANKLTGEDKNKALKSLNQSISDSRKQVRGFGADLKTAFEKMGVWLIAGDVFFKLIGALKDVVVQVKELDKALTSLQIVTQVSNAELENMAKIYIKMGRELGSTLTEVTSAANDFLRAGKTVVETNRLIEDSLLLSKIANINSADSTKYLISAMNAYGLKAREVTSVVDKLSAVDVQAAVSSEGLAISMSKTASSARLAGISMDKLFGYIAAVKEVSQESDEAIGNFYKTLLARMQQVKIGALVDEEGEDISDTQKVLRQYKIEIMDSSNEMRNMGDVLDDLSSKWGNLTTAQRSEVATALAGVRQRDRLLILMQNYSRALDLEKVSLESAGSAAEKYAIFSNSIEAALNRQTLAWQELSRETLESDFVKFFINLSTAMYELLTQLGGLQALLPIIIAMIATIKMKSIIALITRLSSSVMVMGNTLLVAAGATNTLTISLSALKAAMGAITVIIAAVMLAIGKYKQNQEELKQATIDIIRNTQEEIDVLKDLKSEYLELSSKADKSESDKERLIAITDELIKKYNLEKDAIDKLNGSYGEQSNIFDDIIYQKNKELLSQQQSSYIKAKRELEDVSSQTFKLKATKGKRIDNLLKELTPKYTMEVFYGGRVHEVESEKIGESTFGKLLVDEMTQQETLEWLKKYRDAINDLKNPTKKELNYLDALNARISELNEKIEANLKIVTEYEATEAYQKFYKEASNSIAVFQENLQTFAKASSADRMKLIPVLQAQLEEMVSKYPEQEEYLRALASDFTNLAEEIMSADYALDLLQREENEFKREYEELKKEREEQEKILAIEQARFDLQTAKNKKVRIYREGKGFVYETDFSEVQSAQSKLDKLLEEDRYNKKIKEFENLVKAYNKAATEYGVETVRAYFRNEDNMTEYTKSAYKERLELLEKYLEDKQKLEDKAEDKGASGGTTPPSIKDLPSPQVSETTPPTKDKELPSLFENEDNMMDFFNQFQPFLGGDIPGYFGGIQTFHTGGIAGVENFNPSTEVISKLKKGEVILTEGQKRDVALALNEKGSGGTNISIGNVSLPNVQDSDGFIRAMKNIETEAVKSTKTRR